MTNTESNVLDEAVRRPRLELMRVRSQMDWGEAPRYNEAYRKIRWPGKPSETRYYRPAIASDAVGLNLISFNMTSRGLVQLGGPDEGHTETITYRNKPDWISNIAFQKSRKRDGRWSKRDTRSRLKTDLIFCMAENIPFKTRSFEYKPSDQWIYVRGHRALRYDLETGYITEFTYSGRYNKVASLLFRLFEIDIKLIRRKLVWSPPLRRPMYTDDQIPVNPASICVDLNRVYRYQDIHPNETRGFFRISLPLHREYLNT